LKIQLLATAQATLATKVLMLTIGTKVNATLVSAFSFFKNGTGERNPEVHQTKEGQPMAFRHKDQCTCQGGTSVSRHQGPVRIDRGARQKDVQEHSPTGGKICTTRSQDCKPSKHRGAGMSASEQRAIADQVTEKVEVRSAVSVRSGENTIADSSGELLAFNLRGIGAM